MHNCGGKYIREFGFGPYDGVSKNNHEKLNCPIVDRIFYQHVTSNDVIVENPHVWQNTISRRTNQFVIHNA